MHPPGKPPHKALQACYEAVQTCARQEVQHETALRSAFHIVRLVGQVVRASVETMEIVKGLPAAFGGGK